MNDLIIYKTSRFQDQHILAYFKRYVANDAAYMTQHEKDRHKISKSRAVSNI